MYYCAAMMVDSSNHNCPFIAKLCDDIIELNFNESINTLIEIVLSSHEICRLYFGS